MGPFKGFTEFFKLFFIPGILQGGKFPRFKKPTNLICGSPSARKFLVQPRESLREIFGDPPFYKQGVSRCPEKIFNSSRSFTTPGWSCRPPNFTNFGGNNTLRFSSQHDFLGYKNKKRCFKTTPADWKKPGALFYNGSTQTFVKLSSQLTWGQKRFWEKETPTGNYRPNFQRCENLFDDFLLWGCSNTFSRAQNFGGILGKHHL